MKKRACKDCLAEWPDRPYSQYRPAPYPGPRCASHWRAEQKRRKQWTHEKHVQDVYGLRPGEYEALYALQGGRCAICQHAMGLKVRLAVDHDHTTGRPRGLLCRACNRLLGIAGDKPDLFIRGINYLTRPPYEQVVT